MTSDLTALLDHLIAIWENDVVEFKQVTTDYPTSDIGKCFSALANEANRWGAHPKHRLAQSTTMENCRVNAEQNSAFAE